MNANTRAHNGAASGARVALLWLQRSCSGLLLAGLILRIAFKDRIPYLSSVYYALPLPVLLFLAASAFYLARRLRRSRPTRIWGLATIVIALWCLAATCHWHSPAPSPPEPIRVLFWNTCRGLMGWGRVAEFINRRQPDVAGLVEAGEWSEQRREFWRASCPGYHVSMLGGGVVCLTKQPPGPGIAVRLPVQGQYRRLDVVVAEERLTLLIVDMRSNPFVSRQECLLQLSEDADALADRPVVVVGDFNTPADSIHFDPLRSGHRHAFESAGRGYCRPGRSRCRYCASITSGPTDTSTSSRVVTSGRRRPTTARFLADITILPPTSTD